MKIALSWLQDYVAFGAPVDVKALEAALVQLGHEVDGVQAAAALPDRKVVIGKILAREPHPDAGRLGVCQVDVGEGQPRQIVCGAPNARAGLTVPVAMPGAVLPGNVAIGETVLRGVASRGMICSARELGLGDEHSGIMELETTAAVGTPFAETLPQLDTVLDVALTPNRGDCFSHLGLARDLAALGLGVFKPFVELEVKAEFKGRFQAETATPACPQLNLCEVRNLTPGAKSPAWVQARLLAAGLRPKNALVDATNYVMLAVGQPLHAYDAAKLRGGKLAARLAENGEAFAGLGEVNLTLAVGDMVIADEAGVVGLAGILGGAGSAVDETTTQIVLEAAVFDSVAVALTGQRHGLHTDARQRFERGVDPALAPLALRWCAQLVAEWAGGEVAEPVQAGAGVAAPQAIAYDPGFFLTFIGHEVAADRQAARLRALGFAVNDAVTPWQVVPPTWRTFMANPEDLTEEILRLEGYEQVAGTLPPVMPAQLHIDGKTVVQDRLARKALASAGFLEVMTYSFIGRAASERVVDAPANLLELANPLAQTSFTTMRPSLLPGLLQALAKNQAASEVTPRLGEVGMVYRPSGEVLMAAGVLSVGGQRHWRTKEAPVDVFAAKAAVLQVLELLGAPVGSLVVEAGAGGGGWGKSYHPGRSGSLRVGPLVLGVFGELHPTLAQAHELRGPVAAFELDLSVVQKLSQKARPWQAWDYPPVLRDLAFVVPKSVTAQALVNTLKASVPADKQAWVRQLEVFDVYAGAGVPEGQISIAVALTLQNPAGTLSEAEVAPLLEGMIAAAKDKLGASLRG